MVELPLPKHVLPTAAKYKFHLNLVIEIVNAFVIDFYCKVVGYYFT